VEMGSQEDADGAVNALNGREFGGRTLTVNEAREQAPRRGGGGGFGGGGGYGGGGGGRGGRRGF
jgi:RNA recognition motif-containing protein